MITKSEYLKATLLLLFLAIGTESIVADQANDVELIPDFVPTSGPTWHGTVHRAAIIDGAFDYSVEVVCWESPETFFVTGILFIAGSTGQKVVRGGLHQNVIFTSAWIENGPSIRCYQFCAVFYHPEHGFQVVPLESLKSSLGRPAKAELDDYLRRVARGWGFGRSWSLVRIEPQGTFGSSGIHASDEVMDKEEKTGGESGSRR
ncbi:MAG: hypothetical protein IPL39_12570 [Opitutaceae bacterium]|nr:hypothetical protein [Opitutaceae bacterium]